MIKSDKVKREFLGVWIPREIWLDEKLKWMEKLFFTEIQSLDNEKGCFASNNYFADFFHLSPGRASQIIKGLIDKKYISAEYIYDGKEVKQRILRVFNKLNTYLENDKDNNKQSLSKDKDKRFCETPSFKKSPFLEYWNSLKEKYPLIQQHLKPEKKVYQKADTLIKHLKNGTFGEKCFVNREFMKRNHIRLSLLNKQWTNSEIKKNIERLSKLFVEGIWPYDKKSLPKDLATLIYNPRTNASWFLQVFVNPPHAMNSEKTIHQVDNERKYNTTGSITLDEVEDFLEKQTQEWLAETKKKKIG